LTGPGDAGIELKKKNKTTKGTLMTVREEACTARRPGCGIATLLVAGLIVAVAPQAALAACFLPSGMPCGSGSGDVGLSTKITQEAVKQTIDNVIENVRDNVRRQAQPSPPETTSPDGGSGTPRKDSFMPGRGKGSASDPGQSSSIPYGGPGGGSTGPAAREWLYGASLIGSGDRGISLNTSVSVATVAGAVDVTRLGVFSASDALTFIATGLNSWTTVRLDGLKDVNSSVPSTSATLSYLNGGFSTDFSVIASWTPATILWVQDASAIGYTANFQYRVDAPHALWFEPTLGVTYGEQFNGSFAEKASTSTEIHGGLRFGTETRWMGYKVQPTVSAVAFKVVDQSGAAIQIWNPTLQNMVNPAGAVGVRGSAKMTVLWKENFSSYLDFHASTMSSPDMSNIQVLGVQGGLRYSF